MNKLTASALIAIDTDGLQRRYAGATRTAAETD